MPDCFISYTSDDESLARYVAGFLQWRGLKPFLASLSLAPGQQWGQEIKQGLQTSPWVIFLASQKACSSPYVQQEVGGAVFSNKKLIPIFWDMSPHELPGWAKDYQALDLRGLSPQGIALQVNRVAELIHADKQQGGLIAAGILAGLVVLALAATD